METAGILPKGVPPTKPCKLPGCFGCGGSSGGQGSDFCHKSCVLEGFDWRARYMPQYGWGAGLQAYCQIEGGICSQLH